MGFYSIETYKLRKNNRFAIKKISEKSTHLDYDLNIIKSVTAVDPRQILMPSFKTLFDLKNCRIKVETMKNYIISPLLTITFLH